MISMEVCMDIFQLKKAGHSIRFIARKLKLHRKTVAKYLESNSFPEYRRKEKKPSILEPYHQVIRDFLEEDDYQATWILDRLRRMGYTGSYDTLKLFVRTVKERNNRVAYTRFETEPGFQAQVDWGDFKITDDLGKTSTVYAFVMVLGYSRAMYVEFVERCTLETFMDCHIRAFKALRGVPAEVLYDHMKNVVIGRENGKPSFNREFLFFSRHYGFTPRLCPPYSPWVKGKVERPIDYVRERFWRGYAFTSLSEANQDVHTWIAETANQRIHGTHHQQVQARWEEDIRYLGALPPSDYDTSLKFFRKVYKDCLLSFGGNRYYVPSHVVGKKVTLKVKGNQIRIYLDHEMLAFYTVPDTKGTMVGVPFVKPRSEEAGRTFFPPRGKGKATRGITTNSLFPEVARRSLDEYERFAQGGVSWNS